MGQHLEPIFAGEFRSASINDVKIDKYYDIILTIMSATKLVRTTLSLPADLLNSIDRIASSGQVKSRNEFVK